MFVSNVYVEIKLQKYLLDFKQVQVFAKYLGGWHDRECVHDPVGVLLTDLADEQGAHTGAGATTQRVGQLEALQTVAALGLLADHIEHRVDELSALGVVALGPVVSGTALTEHEVVWSEDLSEGSWSHGVHGTGLQIHQYGTGHVFASWGGKGF